MMRISIYIKFSLYVIQEPRVVKRGFLCIAGQGQGRMRTTGTDGGTGGPGEFSLFP